MLLLNQGISLGRIVTTLFGIDFEAASKMEEVIKSAAVSKLLLSSSACQLTEERFVL